MSVFELNIKLFLTSLFLSIVTFLIAILNKEAKILYNFVDNLLIVIWIVSLVCTILFGFISIWSF